LRRFSGLGRAFDVADVRKRVETGQRRFHEQFDPAAQIAGTGRSNGWRWGRSPAAKCRSPRSGAAGQLSPRGTRDHKIEIIMA
jgi:hypothetical protein